MIAQILSTGDEVLLGDIIDTNAAFLCTRAKELGIAVEKITAVGDFAGSIAAVITEISHEADICLVTGGLGPTSDDCSAEACAMAAGDRLEINPRALKTMQAYFAKKGFELNPENEKQALLPSASTMMENSAGTAPGFYLQINQCVFFFMPGVPAEMKIMFETQVKPVLIRRFGLDDDIRVERLTVFGLAESTVGQRMNGFNEQFPKIRIGFRADFPVIEVKLIQHKTGHSSNTAAADLVRARKWVMDRLENKIVSESGRSIAQEVGQLLICQKKNLAIAESCTGGLISNMITDVSGSSEYFVFSAVTYSNDAKVRVLGVDEVTLIEHGAVHEQTAIEMARGARQVAGADIAISTTGIAGPGGGTAQKPVGTVCIGVADAHTAEARQYRFLFGERSRNKTMFATMALELLRRRLVAVGKTA